MTQKESMMFVGSHVLAGVSAVLIFFFTANYQDSFPVFVLFRSAALTGLFYWISDEYEEGKKWARIVMFIFSYLNISLLVYVLGWGEDDSVYVLPNVLLVVIFISVIVFLHLNHAKFVQWGWEPDRELDKLKDLLAKGLINQAEYESRKVLVLAKITGRSK